MRKLMDKGEKKEGKSVPRPHAGQGQTDGRQTVTLRFPLDAASVIEWWKRNWVDLYGDRETYRYNDNYCFAADCV